MSAQITGFALAALQYGYQAVITPPVRSLGPLTGYITMEEVHQDDLEITDHPIEQGASITDHAFKRPAEVTLKIGWSNSPRNPGLLGGIRGLGNTGDILISNLLGQSSGQVADIYQGLLKLQADREPVEVYTGKRLYTDMLIRSLVVTTDTKTENVLMVTATLRQIVRVTTTILQLSQVPAANQREAPATLAPTNSGTKQLVPASNVNTQAIDQAITPR